MAFLIELDRFNDDTGVADVVLVNLTQVLFIEPGGKRRANIVFADRSFEVIQGIQQIKRQIAAAMREQPINVAEPTRQIIQ